MPYAKEYIYQMKRTKRKLSFSDLSWNVHPRMSGVQAQIRCRNGYSVFVVLLNKDQEDNPGFECWHKHSNNTVQKYHRSISNNHAKTVKGLTKAEVDTYIEKIQELPRPVVSDIPVT